jgi:molecular chaperone DnaK
VRGGRYGLGVDIGDESVAAAICPVEDDGAGSPQALPLGEGRAVGSAAVVLRPGEPVRLDVAPDTPACDIARHAMARVGRPAPLYVSGRTIAAGEVVASIVGRIRELAEQQEGTPPAHTVLTVPPSWGSHRRTTLLAALDGVCPDVALVSSAVAAVRHHATGGDLPVRPTVAVYDLGAATLDTAVVGPRGDGVLHHLAAPPAPLGWGGRDIDDALLAHVLTCLEPPTGHGDHGAASSFPNDLRERAVAAKELLAADTVACIELPLPTGTLRLTREELDELIGGRVEDTVELMRAAIRDSGLGPEDLDGIVLSGGSTRLPVVVELLSTGLDVPVTAGPEPELTVALGAAQLAAEAVLAATEHPVGTGGGSGSPADEDPPAADDESVTGPPARVPGRSGRRPVAPASSGTARPPRAPTGRPVTPPGSAARPGLGRRVSRTLVVAVMFVGLVATASSLIAVVSDVDAAPRAQGQTSGDSVDADLPTGTVPAGDVAGEGDSSVFAGRRATATPTRDSRPTGAASSGSGASTRTTSPGTAGAATPADGSTPTDPSAAGTTPPGAPATETPATEATPTESSPTETIAPEPTVPPTSDPPDDPPAEPTETVAPEPPPEPEPEPEPEPVPADTATPSAGGAGEIAGDTP